MARTPTTPESIRGLSQAIQQAFRPYYSSEELDLTRRVLGPYHGYELNANDFFANFMVAENKGQAMYYETTISLKKGPSIAYLCLGALIQDKMPGPDVLKLRTDTLTEFKSLLSQIAKATHDVSKVVSKHLADMQKDLDALVAEHKKI